MYEYEQELMSVLYCMGVSVSACVWAYVCVCACVAM